MNRLIGYLFLALLLSTQFTISEVEIAIEAIEYSRETHVVWRAHILGQQFTLNDTQYQTWWDGHRYVGSLEHHEGCIEKYDQVLSILDRLRDLLRIVDVRHLMNPRTGDLNG